MCAAHGVELQPSLRLFVMIFCLAFFVCVANVFVFAFDFYLFFVVFAKMRFCSNTRCVSGWYVFLMFVPDSWGVHAKGCVLFVF